MGMSIDGLVQESQKTVMICDSVYAYDRKKYMDECIDIMRKYQKIQEIVSNSKDTDGDIKYNWFYEQIREVVEDGNDTRTKED